MRKQVPSHPHSYQKIPDLRSVLLPICTFINCLFLSHRIYSMRAIQTFSVHLLLFRGLLLSCCIVLFGLSTTRLNKTTTTTTTTTSDLITYLGYLLSCFVLFCPICTVGLFWAIWGIVRLFMLFLLFGLFVQFCLLKCFRDYFATLALFRLRGDYVVWAFCTFWQFQSI